MKRLLALLLIALMILSGCKAERKEENAAADPMVEKETAENKEPVQDQETDEENKAVSSEEKEEEQELTERPQEEDPLEEPAKEASDSIVKKVEYNDSTELERLTKGSPGKHFDYEIYYYGIENFYIEADGRTVELREALAKDPEILDSLYAEWEEKHDNRHAFYDGGSVCYPYESYCAYKLHSSTTYFSLKDSSMKHGYIEDLVICRSEESLSEVVDRIMINNMDISGRPGDDRIFTAVSSADPYPPTFVLKKNGRFRFRFSSVSNFAVQGVYSEEGNRLILQTKGEFDYKYVFEKVGDDYCFIASESSEIPSFQYKENTEAICPLPDGTVFNPYS